MLKANKEKKSGHPISMVAGAADGAEAGPILIANILIGLLIGYGIQKVFPGSKPVGLLIGLLLGISSGFYQIFKREALLTRRWKKRKEAEKKKKLEQEK